MPVNTQAVGKRFAAVTYAVGREKVREFARAVLATSPLNLDLEAARAAGYSDVVAPPTFPVVVQELTGCSTAAASSALEQNGWVIKAALRSLNPGKVP